MIRCSRPTLLRALFESLAIPSRRRFLERRSFVGVGWFTYTISDGTDTDEGMVRVGVGVLQASLNPSRTGACKVDLAVTGIAMGLQDEFRLTEDGTGVHEGQVFHGSGQVDGTFDYTLEICRPSDASIMDRAGGYECRAIPAKASVTVAFLPLAGVAATPGSSSVPYRVG